MQPIMWSLSAFTYLVSVWMQVGITKTALGLRTGPLFFYLPVDFGELRVIGAYLVFLAIVYGACIAIGISPISSRNRVPRCACSNFPTCRAAAPVNEPFS